MKIDEVARQFGIETCREFDARFLVPEERIRALCRQNKCGSFNNNYMCPPHVGSLENIKIKLKKFRYGVLFQYAKYVDVPGNRAAVIRTQKDFHSKILSIENCLIEKGAGPIWGLIGGNCRLCDTCHKLTREPCLHPDQARMSLEAIGIDVLMLLERLGLDNRFHKDKITWTGCVLFQNKRYDKL